LKRDHENVKGLFEQIQGDGDMEMESREDLFSQIEEELQLHMGGEERFFYPVLKESEQAHDKVLEAYEEHHVARTVLGEAGDLDKEDERWEAKIKVLNELVEHHIEEEEGKIFKIAKKALAKEQIQEIARQIQQLKDQRAGA
jgi:iron-sulfur cluster repair protein YtfE (RIC family)